MSSEDLEHGHGAHRARNPMMTAGTVSEAWLGGVLDIAVDGIIVIDEQARILVFNKACQDLFGYEADEMLGKNISILMPPEYSAHHDNYLSSYRDTGEKRIIGIGREVAAMHRDGTVFPVELSVGEALTSQGRQFIGILRDLRTRKAFEKRLGQLQAQVLHMARLNALDEMGAVMAHELNQPLTALMLYLQALSRTIGPPVAAEEGGFAAEVTLAQSVLDKALKEAQRAASIIQRMRSMVEKKRAEFDWVDLRRVVRDAVEHTAFVAQGVTVPIQTSLPDDALVVEADAVQIQQILVNLLRNAIEVTKERDERWIKVTLMSSETHAYVHVQDSGSGIPSEVAQNMFRSFTTTKKTGMGLGLAISRSLAQNHGGDLVVDAGGPQPDGSTRGAIFTLSLPLGPHEKDAG